MTGSRTARSTKPPTKYDPGGNPEGDTPGVTSHPLGTTTIGALMDNPLAKALVAALAELEDIPKKHTANMGSHSYTYADLADALSYVRPILAKHGLAVTQDTTAD